MQHLTVTLRFPNWIKNFLQRGPAYFPAKVDRMRLAIALAHANVKNQTGGPFGAAVFQCDTGTLVSVGVNRVVSQHCSFAHAEIMALGLAQQSLGTFDLGGEDLPAHELVTSAQVCVMCFGAIIWSGVRSVVSGATSQDVENIVGFDEGNLPPNWVHELELRGINVETELLRSEAREVLKMYAASNGIVYNGRCGDKKGRDK